MWRTFLKCDIRYIIQAKSDAYCISDDDYASTKGWDYGCDFQTVYKYSQPVNIQDLHKDPYIQDWGAYRGRFQRSVFRISSEQWVKLNQIASSKNSGYQKFLDDLQKERISKAIQLEEQLEENLVHNLGILDEFGYNLALYSDQDTGVIGRQLVCKGNGGRIDLLCYDRNHKQYVVVELKNVCASQNTFGQICNYVGWVQDRIAKGKLVIGLVISRGADARFLSSLKVTDRIHYLDMKQLGYE